MTAYGRFNDLIGKGVMKAAWQELLQMYSARQLKRNPNWFKDIFIDTLTQQEGGGGLEEGLMVCLPKGVHHAQFVFVHVW